MRLLYSIISALLFTASSANGQFNIDDDFENGHVQVVSVGNDTVEVGASSFLHFRITGVAGESPVFRCDQGSELIFKNQHRMVWRYGSQQEWSLMDTGFIVQPSLYYFLNNSPFLEDTVFICYWYPFTYSDLVDYMNVLPNSPHIRNAGPRGLSLQGRNLYGYEITDTTVDDQLKQHVVFTVRQHAQESLGNWVMKGFTGYAAFSNDPEADSLRKKAIIHVYPMINPDGVFNGGNPIAQPDHNDSWFAGNPASGGQASGNHEVDIMRDVIWSETGGYAKYSVDVHSHPGHSGKYYWWGLLSGPSPEKVNEAINLVNRVGYHDAIDHNGVAIINDFISADVWGWPGPWADYWHAETLGSVAFTLEPGSVPTLPQVDRIMDVGASIAKGLNDVLPAPSQPLLPVLAFQPDSFQVAIPMNSLVTDTLTIFNQGQADLVFSIDFIPGDTLPGKESISGSYLASETLSFFSGIQSQVSFELYNGSIDNEWLDSLIISFPAGVHLLDATNFAGGSQGPLVFNGSTGNGIIALWEDLNGGWGNILPGESAFCEMQLFFEEGLDGMLPLIYTIKGDIYGAEPHSVTDTLLISVSKPWLTLEPSSGILPPGQQLKIVLGFSSAGLLPGTYTGNIVMETNDPGHPVNEIPVSCTIQSGFSLYLRAYLEGPFVDTSMNNFLNASGYLSLNQPYNSPPWNYNGTEGVTGYPETDIVDWVLVELRSTSAGPSSAVPDSAVWQKAAFLKTNGRITGLDGQSPLYCPFIPPANIYPVVYHRNHIPLMASTPVVITNDTANYDFTGAVTAAYGGLNAHKEVKPGFWAMISGDGNADFQVGNADKIDVWNSQVGNAGYYSGDFSLDSEVNNQDKIQNWSPNSGTGSLVPQSE